MLAPSGPTWTIAAATESDRAVWQRLFEEYAATAGEVLGDDHLTRVWAWITAADAQTRCLLLRAPGQDEPVGLAHYRVFERPLAGSRGCFLDDLFVGAEQRGRGGARALLEHLAVLAGEHGWSTVRWTTGETNPAQRLYDSLADRSPVITYDRRTGPVPAP